MLKIAAIGKGDAGAFWIGCEYGELVAQDMVTPLFKVIYPLTIKADDDQPRNPALKTTLPKRSVLAKPRTKTIILRLVATAKNTP